MNVRWLGKVPGQREKKQAPTGTRLSLFVGLVVQVLSRLRVCLCCVVCVCVSVCVVSVCVGVVCLSPEVNGPCGPEWHVIAGTTLVDAAYLTWEESPTNENVTLAIISGLEDVCILDERSPDDVL